MLKTKTVLQLKKSNFIWLKISTYLTLGLQSTALKREYPAFQHVRFFTLFYLLFSPFWIRIQKTKIIADPYGPGSTTLSKSQIFYKLLDQDVSISYATQLPWPCYVRTALKRDAILVSVQFAKLKHFEFCSFKGYLHLKRVINKGHIK
jgi:hypothetical protein